MLSIISCCLTIVNQGRTLCVFQILDTNNPGSSSVVNIPSRVQLNGKRNLGLHEVMVRSREHASRSFPNGAALRQSPPPAPHTVTLTLIYTSFKLQDNTATARHTNHLQVRERNLASPNFLLFYELYTKTQQQWVLGAMVSLLVERIHLWLN
jgi:hypothetical protein